MFPSKSFIAVALTFGSLIYFELIFWIHYEVWVQIHLLACGYPVLPAPFVENNSSLLHGFGTLVENPLIRDIWVYFWTLNTLHWYICLSLCQYHIDWITVALKYWNWKVWVYQVCSFFPQDHFIYLDPLHFLMNFRSSLSISVKRQLDFWEGLHWVRRSISYLNNACLSIYFIFKFPYQCAAVSVYKCERKHTYGPDSQHRAPNSLVSSLVAGRSAFCSNIYCWWSGV